MSNIYELKENWKKVSDMLYEEEIDEQMILDTLESIEGEIEDKADGYAKIIKNLLASSEAKKAEAKLLLEKAKNEENKANLLKTNLEETMPETQIKAGQELIAYLKQKYGISKVQKHSDVCNTSCPGKNFPFEQIANGQIVAENKPKVAETYTYKDFVGEVQKACGAKVDGIAGTETLSKTVTISKTKNSRHAVVKPIQKYLNALGFNCGAVDGIAGKLFDSAVKSYQKANSCVCDGEITAKNKTWKKLLKLA